MADHEQAADNVTDWDGMEIGALVAAQRDLMLGISAQVDRLLQLAPILRRRLKDELGLHTEIDYSQLSDALGKLAGATTARGPRGSRRKQPKPDRFLLVYRESGEPVMDAAGEPIRFRTRARILRGPRYEALLGKSGVKKVMLVDTHHDNQVVTEHLTLGPAPGRAR